MKNILIIILLYSNITNVTSQITTWQYILDNDADMKVYDLMAYNDKGFIVEHKEIMKIMIITVLF